MPVELDSAITGGLRADVTTTYQRQVIGSAMTHLYQHAQGLACALIWLATDTLVTQCDTVN